MPAVGLKVTDTATPLLGRVSGSLLDVTKKGALKAAERVRSIIDREARAAHPRGTGRLPGSFQATLLQSTSGKAVSAALSDLSYAGIQNRGGVIRPRVRKNLAIPLRQRERTNFIWPRNFTGGKLVPITSKRGNKLLALVSGKKIEPVYLLKPQVTIRGSRYLDKARAKALPEAQKVFGADVKLAIRDAGKGQK